MSIISYLIDFIVHIDKNLVTILNTYGSQTYLILFLIIFFETGVVITPFLPGDSLIFLAGALAARASLKLYYLFLIFLTAAIFGDTLNYSIGKYFGKRIEKLKVIKKEHLEKTQEFYKHHGGKTIILSRFLPIVRTFAPFIAGVGNMYYGRFFLFNILGGFLWVSILLFSGYYLGTFPWVHDNLSTVILIIILISILPGIFEYLRQKIKERITKKNAQNNQLIIGASSQTIPPSSPSTPITPIESAKTLKKV